jgi:hypothetical protein
VRESTGRGRVGTWLSTVVGGQNKVQELGAFRDRKFSPLAADESSVRFDSRSATIDTLIQPDP